MHERLLHYSGKFHWSDWCSQVFLRHQSALGRQRADHTHFFKNYNNFHYNRRIIRTKARSALSTWLIFPLLDLWNMREVIN